MDTWPNAGKFPFVSRLRGSLALVPRAHSMCLPLGAGTAGNRAPLRPSCSRKSRPSAAVATLSSTWSGSRTKRASFQVIQGRGTDPARAHELMMRNREEWADFRPDVLGSSMVVLHPDNAYTMAAYFTSEQQAREGNARSHRRH
jgi:hypothetical protein